MMGDKQKNNRDKSTNFMFGFLAFLGVLTLILGFVKIGRSINDPVQPKYVAGEDVQQMPSAEELQLSDTDGDGLSDYQELYQYGTSMYLADSDSDGYSDGEEVRDGYDPNCPKGEDCRGFVERNTSSVTEGNDTTSEKTNLGEVTSDYNVEATTGEDITPQQVRQLLVESGELTSEQMAELDNISDEMLMEVFQEVLSEQQ